MKQKTDYSNLFMQYESKENSKNWDLIPLTAPRAWDSSSIILVELQSYRNSKNILFVLTEKASQRFSELPKHLQVKHLEEF